MPNRCPNPRSWECVLNCKYWDVEGTTTLDQKELLAVCVYPELKSYALIVSGTSACNKWKTREPVDPEAKAYSKLGEKSE